MRSSTVALALAALASMPCMAQEALTQAQAEALLKPYMSKDCGSYYTTQGEPDFADLDNKAMCTYEPRVTRLKVNGASAAADYNHDRHFDEAMAQAWLADYAKMEAHQSPSLLFKTLKKNLERWRTESAGVDHAERPGGATFRYGNGTWQVESAPQ